MAEAEKTEPKEEAVQAKGNKTPLLIAGTAVLSLALGFGVNSLFFKPEPATTAPVEEESQPAAEASEHEQPADESKKGTKKGEETPFSERVVTLEPFVVNLRGADYPRYVKVSIGIEAENLAAKGELEARNAQIRDAVILLLSSKELDEITEYEGKAFLKEEIQRRLNDLLQAGTVKSVLFTEFVIQ